MEATKEYKKYLDDINDRFFIDARPVIEHIQNCKCPGCGSNSFNDGKCSYCMGENKVVEEDLKKIEDILRRYLEAIENVPDSKSIQINQFMNMLASMDTVKSTKVEEFLKLFDYREKYQTVLDKALESMRRMLIEDVKLTPFQLSVIESQLLFSKYRWTREYTPYEENEGNRYAMQYLFFIKNAGSRDNQISYEAFRQLVMKYTNAEITRALGFNRGGLCEVINEPEEERLENHLVAVAYHEYDKISLTEEIIKTAYEGENLGLTDTIFHELSHMKQYYYGFMYGNHFKDKILAAYLPDYYDTNYSRTSFEKEAFVQGYLGCFQILKSIGIDPRRGYQEQNLDYIRGVFNSYGDPIRIVNGEERNIDDIFADFISKRPDIFKEYDKKYKYLHLLYKIVDNTVVPKSEEEIKAEYEDLKARGVKSYEKPVEELYQYFLRERGQKLQ